MTSLPTTGRLLAIDWGELRIGLGAERRDPDPRLPSKPCTCRRGKRFPWPASSNSSASINRSVSSCGLPFRLEGGETRLERLSPASWPNLVARRTSLPVELSDERLTTSAEP